MVFVEGNSVDWLEVKDGNIILSQPEDITLIGEHDCELKLFYPVNPIQSDDSE